MALAFPLPLPPLILQKNAELMSYATTLKQVAIFPLSFECISALDLIECTDLSLLSHFQSEFKFRLNLPHRSSQVYPLLFLLAQGSPLH